MANQLLAIFARCCFHLKIKDVHENGFCELDGLTRTNQVAIPSILSFARFNMCEFALQSIFME